MTDKTLYAITVIFNPRQFKSRYRLYREFKQYIESCGPNIKLLTVEISYANRPFEVTTAEDPWNLQMHTDYELWHKEAGMNAGLARLKQLMPDAKYCATLDADVSFSNKNWVTDTINALQHHHVVQPFSEAHNLTQSHESEWKCKSILKKFSEKGFHQNPPLPLGYFASGHPGLAWAWRIKTLDQLGGLLDFCVAGSGDSHMANALMGDITLNMRKGMSTGYRRALERYAKRCDKYVGQNIGFVPGMCTHYFHGKSTNRGYEKRWDIICFHQFDPEEDIYKELNNLYRWKGGKPEMYHDLKLSLVMRNEDQQD